MQKPPDWGLEYREPRIWHWLSVVTGSRESSGGGEVGWHWCSCQPHPQGKIGDRVGFFPANFVQRVRPGENVWRCCQPFSGNKEQGYLSLKENQVSAGPCSGYRRQD